MTPLLSDYDGRATTTVLVRRIDSPIGILHVASFEQGVCALALGPAAEALEPRLRRAFGPFFRIAEGDPLDVEAALARYFDGALRALDDVPIAAPATPMQRRVWDLVRNVAPGQVTTYAALAERMGMPRAQRAVGVCLASNPVPVLMPCHRVVAASGGLGSHPGGPMCKAALLAHEGALEVARAASRRSFVRAREPERLLDAAAIAAT